MASAWIEHDPPSRGRVVTGWLVAVGTVALLVVGAWVLAWAWRDRLPDPLAIHWGADGAADGTATLDGTIRVTTGLGLAGVMALVVVGAALLGRPRWLRGWMTGLAPVAALAPASLVLTLLPNLGVPQWQQAAISGWEILIVLVVPGLAAGVAWFAAARPARASTVGPTIAPDAPIATTHAAYEERQVMRVGMWIAAATIAVILALALPLGWVALVVGVPIVGVLAWLSVYRYRVDDTGLVLRFGPVGPMSRQVPVTEIEGARVVDLQPGHWGGWGYRTTGRDWAVVLRSGPGARLDLAGRRSLSLTSDDAVRLAGRVNASVQRYWAQGPG